MADDSDLCLGFLVEGCVTEHFERHTVKCGRERKRGLVVITDGKPGVGSAVQPCSGEVPAHWRKAIDLPSAEQAVIREKLQLPLV